jgi:hypothetical protein
MSKLLHVICTSKNVPFPPREWLLNNLFTKWQLFSKIFSPLFSQVIIMGMGVQRVQKSVHCHSFRHWCHCFPQARGQCEQSATNYKWLFNWLTADLRNGEQWERGIGLDRCFFWGLGERGGWGQRKVLYSTKVDLWNGKKKKKKKTIWLGELFFLLIFTSLSQMNAIYCEKEEREGIFEIFLFISISNGVLVFLIQY